MVARVSSPIFIGRADELARLEVILDAAAAGRFTTLVVGGEAGVGKTRLVGELLARSDGRGFTTLLGGCIDLAEGVLPYAPLAEAIRRLAASMPVAELDRILGPARAYLTLLIPDLAPEPALDLVPGEPGRMFELVLGVLHRLTQRHPALLVIEDLHWADRSTRDLLRFLVRNGHGRMLIAVTYRSDHVPRTHPLRTFLAELTRDARAERMHLQRLGRRDMTDLLGAILAEPPPAELVTDIMTRSDGNPFHAEELVSAHRRGGAEPTDLYDALLGRVHTLSEKAQETIAAAATAGNRVDHDLLRDVTGTAPDVLEGHLREAIECGVLVTEDGGNYRFRHSLVQEAVYRDLLPARRAALHARYADTIDRRGTQARSVAELGCLACHRHAAGDLGRAAAAYVAAGIAAEAAIAPAEALQYFEHADELWDRAPGGPLDRPALLERAADAASLMSDTTRAAALTERALALIGDDDPARTGALLARLAEYQWQTADLDRSAATIERAVAVTPNLPPTRQRAAVLAADASLLLLRGRPDEARQRGLEAVATARAAGARREEGLALNTVGSANSLTGRTVAAIEALEEALRVAEEVGSVEDLCHAYHNLSVAFTIDGRADDAIRVALAGCERARQLGLVHGYGAINFIAAAWGLLNRGSLGDVEGLLAELFEFDLRSVNPRALEVRAELRLWQGDPDAAWADLRALQDMDGAAHPYRAAAVHQLLAHFHLAKGRPAEAEAAVGAGLASLANTMPDVVVALCVIGLGAVAASSSREASGADLLRRARAAAGSVGPHASKRLLAKLAMAEAEWTRIAGPGDPVRWREVARNWDRFGSLYLASYARCRQAEALVAAGAATRDVAAVVVGAWEQCDRAGFRPLADELAAIARRARVRLPEKSSGTVAAPLSSLLTRLTRREREVLVLLADGLTNGQIAEKLYISQNTASVHVSHILTKLGVANRGQAVAAARRLGLV
ncbi:ATP-binding protein [Virgisporangium aurantiacum]|uniref:Helix-turn-helix transcriptional regulator n=1 Tax=Virgisporangium aurantiacum TaxID=175570 RepID=A0A8J3ZC23_9ACTN|nr:helix-turn-helix transcriptional regulator [Virgisporangium aurantiacum]GIJ58896.1 helix-turn-helix transcriptional regulator [Virgisporangium aurantiacum]